MAEVPATARLEIPSTDSLRKLFGLVSNEAGEKKDNTNGGGNTEVCTYVANSAVALPLSCLNVGEQFSVSSDVQGDLVMRVDHTNNSVVWEFLKNGLRVRCVCPFDSVSVLSGVDMVEPPDLECHTCQTRFDSQTAWLRHLNLVGHFLLQRPSSNSPTSAKAPSQRGGDNSSKLFRVTFRLKSIPLFLIETEPMPFGVQSKWEETPCLFSLRQEAFVDVVVVFRRGVISGDDVKQNFGMDGGSGRQ